MICPQCGTLNANTQEECVRCKTRLRTPEMAGKIPCANHARREATTSCASCGARLCSACAVNANGVDFCDACAPPNAVRPSYEEAYQRVAVVDVAVAPTASFGMRLLGLAIDGLLVFAGGMVAALLFWMFAGLDFLSREMNPGAFWFYWTLVFLGAAIYTILLTAMNGQTVGKQIAGVIVLRQDGKVISLRESVIRFAVSVVSALPLGLGYWWALWDRNQETWHDKAAKTRVFRWEESA